MTIDDIMKSPDFSLEDINIGDYLDSLLYKDRDTTLQQILQKLNPNGTITISGTDMGVVTSIISSNKIDIVGANTILENIKSMAILNDLERFLYNFNFSIAYKNIEGFGKYTISAKHKI